VEDWEKEILQTQVLPRLYRAMEYLERDQYDCAYEEVNDAVVTIANRLLRELSLQDLDAIRVLASTTPSFSLGLVVPGVRLLHALAVFAHALRAWLGSCERPQPNAHTEPLSSPSERCLHTEDMRPVDRDPYKIENEEEYKKLPQFLC